MIHPASRRRLQFNEQRLRDTSTRAWAPCLLMGVAILVFSSIPFIPRLIRGSGLITLGLALCLVAFVDCDDAGPSWRDTID